MPNKCCAVCAFINEKPTGAYFCPHKGEIKTQEVFSRSCDDWLNKEYGIIAADEVFENAAKDLGCVLKELYYYKDLSDRNYDAYIELKDLLASMEIM
jgi:hypothetical protein